MKEFVCELHVHSCLSPCAEDDMTPYSIAGMAKLAGLDVVALTDHNTIGNCGVFLHACAHYGIVGLAGMELTTAEDVHLICLFPSLDAAEAFSAEVWARRSTAKNRPAVFGRQLLINDADEAAGEEERMLYYATDWPIEQAAACAISLGGAAYPAHIDRESNGVIAVLGAFPEEPRFAAAEFHGTENIAPYRVRYALFERLCLTASDAHRLWEIGQSPCKLMLDCADDAGTDDVRAALLRRLRGV